MPHGTKLNRSFRAFIERQKLFFVATAAASGRVNVSPKGADTLRILDDTRLIWLNLSGSGNETAGHLQDLNRMTLMFCAFDGDPLILRLYGTARTVHPRDADWPGLLARFPDFASSRQIFDFTIESLQTSCGSGVPEMQVTRERVADDLDPFYAEMGPDGLKRYWSRKNTETIDGRPTGIFDD